MERAELLDLLIDLARDAGIQVRSEARVFGGDLAPRSGVCRVRGELWLMLLPGDSLEDRIDAVSSALRTHAPALLEKRYLPPAVRAALRLPGGENDC